MSCLQLPGWHRKLRVPRKQTRFLRHWGPQRSFGCSLRRPRTIPNALHLPSTVRMGISLPRYCTYAQSFNLDLLYLLRNRLKKVKLPNQLSSHPPTHSISSIWHRRASAVLRNCTPHLTLFFRSWVTTYKTRLDRRTDGSSAQCSLLVDKAHNPLYRFPRNLARIHESVCAWITSQLNLANFPLLTGRFSPKPDFSVASVNLGGQ